MKGQECPVNLIRKWGLPALYFIVAKIGDGKTKEAAPEKKYNFRSDSTAFIASGF